jgi:Bacteriophage head to tail connecting protein.
VQRKVIFLVSPSATTKRGTLAKAGNGAIIQGRPEDVGVVQVGKTADFSTAANLAASIEKRILEAFLVMNVRNAERVTAEEVRLTQLELEKSLGGLFSLLTVEFLVPYLNRTLLILQRSNQIPRLPKDIVRPKIVAGINSLGRGQDNEALTRFIATVAQTLGPDALIRYIDPSEAIKRLAAAQGIDVLNLVRTAEQLEQMKQDMTADATQKSLVDQAGQLAGTPLMNPESNPELADQAAAVLSSLQPPE